MFSLRSRPVGWIIGKLLMMLIDGAPVPRRAVLASMTPLEVRLRHDP
jgi:hypothetical protein